MTLSLEKAELIGAFTETLAYGAYLMVVVRCLSVLRKRSTKDPSSWYLPLTTALLFITITMHLVTDIARAVEAFTGDESNPLHPAEYYADLPSFASAFKTIVYTTVTVLSDAFIVYRAFIVWNRSYAIIALPFLLFLADTAMGYTAAYSVTLIKPGETFHAIQLARRTQAFYSLTLSLNVICTILIAIKIWTIQRQTSLHVASSGSTTSLSRVATIVVESCAIYSALLFVLIGTYARNSPAMFIILDTTAPIIGIVFSSVIVRIGKGVSHGDSTTLRVSALHFNPQSISVTTDISSRTAGQDDVSFPLEVRRRTETIMDYDAKMKSSSLTEVSAV
ncbi:hypothetical protein AcW2_004164 [Taiwanofungus camphoratus]|nr:hypothetical protein AcW2_004164 [Antrodia cinnamomea]